ncbi:MAG: HupE/UreJ family protein [bacterium]|nr:HupE/UreJ family protein [bacterium]
MTRVLALWTLVAGVAAAHPLAPALLELRAHADGRVDVVWKVPARGVPGVELVPELPAHCRTLDAPAVVEDDDSRTSRWRVDCGARGLVGEVVTVHGLALARTDALVRLVLADGRIAQEVARPSAPAPTLPAPARPATVVGGYLRLGVAHIAGGPDHLLFVLGLVLLAGATRRLLATVTAFTLGHSVTLALAMLGVVAVPAMAVEVAIAGTLYLLAVELTRDPAAGSAWRRHPAAMAFAFGLLHGLGFASALREAGLPPDDVPRALLSFNAGIELGQLLFVAAALAAAAACRRIRPAAAPGARLAVPYAVGSLAVYWGLERLTALLRA